MVPKKGHDPHAIEMVAREIRISGYSKMILKSDPEPTMRELLDAVKRERIDARGITSRRAQVLWGSVENTAQVIQGQLRTLRLGLQSRYQIKLRADHPVMPWVIKHAAFLINVCRVGGDGRTAWERSKGKRFNRQLPEIGECVWFLKP